MIKTDDAPATDTALPVASLGNSVLKLQDISKSYDSDRVLQNLNLETFKGEFLTLVGPAGCGKSTILRLIAGLEAPTVGRILLGGAEVTATPAKQRSVNMVFQVQALFPHLSVEQNIAFGLKQERMPAPEIRARVEELLSLFDLTDINRRKPFQLSKRQGLRVALARSLARNPQLLLLDDPLDGFEKTACEELSAELASLPERADVSILMATRNRDTAMTVSDRIGVMDRGQLVQVGSPGKVYGAPVSGFVARYIADMNVLHGEVTANAGDTLEIKCTNIDTVLRTSKGSGQSIGNAVSIGLRPESLRLQQNAPTEESINALLCTITNIIHAGNQRVLHVALNDGTIIRVAQANWNDELSLSDKVWLHWSIDTGTLLSS